MAGFIAQLLSQFRQDIQFCQVLRQFAGIVILCTIPPFSIQIPLAKEHIFPNTVLCPVKYSTTICIDPQLAVDQLCHFRLMDRIARKHGFYRIIQDEIQRHIRQFPFLIKKCQLPINQKRIVERHIHKSVLKDRSQIAASFCQAMTRNIIFRFFRHRRALQKCTSQLSDQLQRRLQIPFIEQVRKHLIRPSSIINGSCQTGRRELRGKHMYAPLLKTVFIVPNILEMFFCLGMRRDFSQSILCVNDRIHPVARLDFASCRNQYRMVLRKFPAAGLHQKGIGEKAQHAIFCQIFI